MQNWFAGVRPVSPGYSEEAAYITAAGQRAITVGDGLANAAKALGAQRSAGVLCCKRQFYRFTRASRQTLVSSFVCLFSIEKCQGDVGTKKKYSIIYRYQFSRSYMNDLGAFLK